MTHKNEWQRNAADRRSKCSACGCMIPVGGFVFVDTFFRVACRAECCDRIDGQDVMKEKLTHLGFGRHEFKKDKSAFVVWYEDLSVMIVAGTRPQFRCPDDMFTLPHSVASTVFSVQCKAGHIVDIDVHVPDGFDEDVSLRIAYEVAASIANEYRQAAFPQARERRRFDVSTN